MTNFNADFDEHLVLEIQHVQQPLNDPIISPFVKDPELRFSEPLEQSEFANLSRQKTTWNQIQTLVRGYYNGTSCVPGKGSQ